MSRIDFLAYPPTQFPFRDLLVLEQLPLSPADTVCEIGVGSGGTTARLARMCAGVTGFEISRATVEALRYLEERHPNLRFQVADVTDPATVTPWAGRFTRLIACDTLEHVNDPRAFFRAVATLLAPGGEFLVTFPNEPLHKMHGVTRFETREDLAALVREAGLTDVRIAAARLAGGAAQVADAFGWKPVEIVRKVLRRGDKKPATNGDTAGPTDAPQTFEETHFYKRMNTWRRLSPVINAYWYGVLKLMDARGPAFELDDAFRAEPFTDCQLTVTGRKPRG